MNCYNDKRKYKGNNLKCKNPNCNYKARVKGYCVNCYQNNLRRQKG